jgi:hypothetical protein
VPSDARIIGLRIAIASTAAAGDPWQSYHSDRGAFEAGYPADWIVSEETRTDGAVVTTFASASGGVWIAVISQTPLPAQIEPPEPVDIPNTRCEVITVDGLPGTRCFDTIAFSTTTTFMNERRSYTVIASTKGTQPDIYQRFLDSFNALA